MRFNDNYKLWGVTNFTPFIKYWNFGLIAFWEETPTVPYD
jgi:hypothetical protein